MPSFDFVASEGVVFSAGDNSLPDYFAGAYYWQSKMYQNLDPPPTPPGSDGKMILGMSVSEKQDPFSSFSSLRVVRGSPSFDTQVYESGVWQTKPCRVPKTATDRPLRASTGCAYCNGRVYITTEHSREIFVYDFEKSRWSSVFSPCDWVSNHPQHYCLDTLGAWNSRVFDVTCDFESGRKKKILALQVWELVDETLHKWKVYDCMPKGLCSWLRSTRGFSGAFPTKTGELSLQASFCGDFLLVYSWNFLYGLAGRFCLFNMATKNWQKLNIAAATVMITEEDSSDPNESEDSDLYDSEDSDDSFDLYGNANESSLDEFMMEDDDDDDDDEFD